MAELFLYALAGVLFVTLLVSYFRTRRALVKLQCMTTIYRKHAAKNDADIRVLFSRVCDLERIKLPEVNVVEGPRALRG